MSLLVRDNRVYTLALRDPAPTSGPLNALLMNVAGSWFTESIDVGTFTEGIAFLFVSGATGTLDVKMQYSPDNIHWIDSGDAFTQVTTTNGLTLKKLTANFGKYVRFRLDLGSSPSYTVSLFLALKG